MAHRFRTIQDTHKTRTGGRYDAAHMRARKQAALRHHPNDPCTRCGQPLGPMGKWLHYDHTDTGDGYLGFAHASCNMRAGSRKGHRAQRRVVDLAVPAGRRLPHW